MKNFSNLYIFSFSAIMVIIVAALLSFVSEELNPLQERNVELEKKTDILRSVNKTEGMAEADSKDVFIENQFKEFIRESFLVNSKGELLDGNAFEVTKNLRLNMISLLTKDPCPYLSIKMKMEIKNI
jgi:Na+-transporting NADH:ubiquinone oxidoreductase subunit C